jgi:hypothetical protein
MPDQRSRIGRERAAGKIGRVPRAGTMTPQVGEDEPVSAAHRLGGRDELIAAARETVQQHHHRAVGVVLEVAEADTVTAELPAGKSAGCLRHDQVPHLTRPRPGDRTATHLPHRHHAHQARRIDRSACALRVAGCGVRGASTGTQRRPRPENTALTEHDARPRPGRNVGIVHPSPRTPTGHHHQDTARSRRQRTRRAVARQAKPWAVYSGRRRGGISSDRFRFGSMA